MHIDILQDAVANWHSDNVYETSDGVEIANVDCSEGSNSLDASSHASAEHAMAAGSMRDLILDSGAYHHIVDDRTVNEFERSNIRKIHASAQLRQLDMYKHTNRMIVCTT